MLTDKAPAAAVAEADPVPLVMMQIGWPAYQNDSAYGAPGVVGTACSIAPASL